jgi:hypothetical protein
MRRLAILTLTICFAALPAIARADHIPPQLGVFPAPLPAPPGILSEGPIRFVSNTSTGRSFAGTLGEVAPFTRDGKKYIVAGSSVYGFSVIDVTDPASPQTISEYSSAFGCPGSALMQVTDGSTDPIEIALGYGGWENDISWSPDGQWVVMGMDAPGRCHDPIFGGIEIVNLSDVTNPTLVHLVRNNGQAHSVTLDPKRPWMAYISTSDSEDVLYAVNYKSCMGTPAATCRPDVAAVVFDFDYFPALYDKTTKEDRTTDGCHDLRFYGDRAYCAAVGSTLILDVSKGLRSDGRLSGTHLNEGADACEVVDADPVYAPGIKVTDCRNWHKDVFRDRKANVMEIPLVAVIDHDGSKPATEDISIAHQAEAIADGKIMMITDERGGGLGTDTCPGGGVWFYDIRDEKNPVLMRQPDGSPGVYLTQWNIPNILGQNPSCTAHYGKEFADENLLTFGWYTNGMRVLRYYPDFTKSPAQIRFEEIAGFAGLDLTIDSMVLARNPDNADEVLVYAANVLRGIDVFAVETPRLTRAAAFGGAVAKPAPKPKPVAPPKVGGTKTTRGGALPGTGIADPGVLALILLALALAGHSLRRKTAP